MVYTSQSVGQGLKKRGGQMEVESNRVEVLLLAGCGLAVEEMK